MGLSVAVAEWIVGGGVLMVMDYVTQREGVEWRRGVECGGRGVCEGVSNVSGGSKRDY